MSTRSQVWIGVGFLLVLTILTILAAVFSKGSTDTPVVATEAAVLSAADHSKGPSDAKVSVIEYGDFQCPSCAQYEPVMKQLETEYAEKVQFVFRNFPLYQLHPNAGTASQAAEAAGLQGKYWEMHDMLYTKQAEWSPAANYGAAVELFAGYAETLGLDKAKFTTDLDSSVVKDKINADVASGNDAQIDHTPTFFLNLKQIKNPTNYGEFKSIIDAALASTTAQ